ncbi:MFS general substrate transporter [Rhizopogon salebrosus TDB-379]|nr:MFS general substrate transporter [Rhizopogon salebrosus TDB-379]
MNALAPNIQTVIVSRALQGVFGSTGASLVGGVIADMWEPHERGFPMSLFAFAIMFSLGLGSAFGGLIAANPHLGWRWVQWIHVIFSAAYVLNVALVLYETRCSIILARIAKDIRKATGDPRYRSSFEIDKPSLLSMIKTTLTRPLYLLLTEPIVQSVSCWCGLTWGVVYCFLESASTEFQSVYKLNVSQTGLIFLSQRKASLLHAYIKTSDLCLNSIGAVIGFAANRYQEVLYRKHFQRKHQEARLYMACVAAIILPVSMFIYAWTALPNIHWIVPAIGLTAFMSGVLIIYQVAFLYLADCYGPYASSAQAGQSLARNIMAMILPLAISRMVATMTFRWAITTWATLAVVLAPVPWVLYFFGPKIRSRSKISRKILEAEGRVDREKIGISTEDSVANA